jgi:hypothetical protein
LLTYTPILKDSAGNVLNTSSYKFRTGTYIQIGNLVWFQVNLGINNKSGLGVSSNRVEISLPIASTSTVTQTFTVSNVINTLSNISWISGQVPRGNSILYCNFPVKISQLSVSEFLKNSDMASGFEIYFGGYYFA